MMVDLSLDSCSDKCVVNRDVEISDHQPLIFVVIIIVTVFDLSCSFVARIIEWFMHRLIGMSSGRAIFNLNLLLF